MYLSELETNVEQTLRRFAKTAKRGEYVDIPLSWGEIHQLRNEIGKYAQRYIRKQAGSIDGSYSMSGTAAPDVIRITLLVSLDRAPIRDPEWDQYQRLRDKFERLDVLARCAARGEDND